MTMAKAQTPGARLQRETLKALRVIIRRNADQAVGTSGPFEIVQQLVNDHRKGDGDEREIGLPGPHGRKPDDEAEGGGDDGGDRQRQPEVDAPVERRHGRAVGPDAIGCAGGEVGDVGAAELEVQRQRQHRVDLGDHRHMQHIGVAAGNQRKQQREGGAIGNSEARPCPNGIRHPLFEGGIALRSQKAHDRAGEGCCQHLPALDDQESPGKAGNKGDEANRQQPAMASPPTVGAGAGASCHDQTFSIALRPTRPVGRKTRKAMTTRNANTWR